MLFGFYVLDDQLIAPTTARVQENHYREVEPVLVVAAFDEKAVAEAIAQTLSRGNPPAPQRPLSETPQPVVLKYAKIKRWSLFEKKSRQWVIEQEDGLWRLCRHKPVIGSQGTTLDEDAIMPLGNADLDIAELAARASKIICNP